jgi:myo-inositol 2-dehydrogenase / D-chiro-inositol 1-dehydrogenase
MRIGVIGVGRIGLFHARTLRALDGVDALAIADADPARAAAAAAELDATAVASPAELVAARVDALVVATPTPAHAAMIRLGVEAGIPVFCEKPVALELAALDALVGEVERSGVLVQIGFQRRFDAGYRAARDAVAAGELGTLLAVRAATHDPSPPPEAYIAVSGGIFRDLHIHDFDAIRYVTGEEIVEVYADGAVRETAWFADHGDVDTAVAVLRLAGGGLAILSGTRHDPRGYDVRLELFGTGDSLLVGSAERALRSVEPGAAPAAAGYANFLERFEAAYRGELAAFVAAVRDGGESPCTVAEARAALRVALAADRSRREHRPVSTGAEAVAG